MAFLVSTNKGNQKLQYGDHVYHKLNSYTTTDNITKYYWVCDKQKRTHLGKQVKVCDARITTILDDGSHQVIKENLNHLCNRSASDTIAQEIRHSVKDMAKVSQAKPSQIIQQMTSTIPVQKLVHAPSSSAMTRLIQR